MTFWAQGYSGKPVHDQPILEPLNQTNDPSELHKVFYLQISRL